MNEIIKVNEIKFDGDPVLTVNARELHSYLKIGRDYSTWINNRITEFGFVPEIDFTLFEGLTSPKLGSSKSRAQRTVEYHLTLDTAKEISMAEKNEVGREVRRYFIAVEKAYREGKSIGQHAFKEIRDKSKFQRRRFTDTLKSSGYTKQPEYIQTTMQMKKELGITNKKDQMDELELLTISASETIAEINVRKSGAFGYHEVNPVCVESCQAVIEATKTGPKRESLSHVHSVEVRRDMWKPTKTGLSPNPAKTSKGGRPSIEDIIF